jgi:predicted permease
MVAFEDSHAQRRSRSPLALRTMVKRPGFTLVAVLSLALGIGANSTIFTFAKAAFLESVPVENPSEVVMVYSTQASRHGPEAQFLDLSYFNARDLREKSDVFGGVSLLIGNGAQLTVGGKNIRVQGGARLVNWDFFKILGVQPALGRSFTQDEDSRPGAAPVAILSYALWNNQFAADASIIGKTIVLNQQQFTVIGVAPREFQNAGALGSPGLWVPMAMHDVFLTDATARIWFSDRGARTTGVVARLKPGVSQEATEQALRVFADTLSREYPKDNHGRSLQLVPINNTVIPPTMRDVAGKGLSLMMAVVGLVLLIACANVANLLLARATLRRREIAIRLSLGAARRRLIQQLLTESALLGIVAGAVAILFALWGRHLIAGLLPLDLSRRLDVALDGRVLLFTLLLSLVATILFGLVPALQSTSVSTGTALRTRSGLHSERKWFGLRGLLVALQVTLCVVALVGAGLFIHSLRNAQDIDPGFEVKHELTVAVNTTASGVPEAQAQQLFEEVVTRLRALPMAAETAAANCDPLDECEARTTFPDGVDSSDPSNGTLTPDISVQPRFFSAAGIALLRGRDFTDADNARGAIAKREVTLSSFLAVFKSLGFTVMDADPSAPGDKIALYTLGGAPTHAARHLTGETWTSKLGSDEDIEHQLKALEGPVYGNLETILGRRPK